MCFYYLYYNQVYVSTESNCLYTELNAELLTRHTLSSSPRSATGSSYVLKMWTDLLRSHQTLHHNRIVIKMAFGSVKKHAVRHSRSKWDLPLSTRERYLWATRVIRIKKCMAMLGLRVNQEFRITGSRKSGRLQARPNIVRQREHHV